MNYPDMTVFGHDPWWLMLAKALGIFVFLLLTVLMAILVERKLLGRMQMRYGPNRVGPFGLLQSLADGVVWLPLNSPGSAVHRDLGVGPGDIVGIAAGGPR